MKLIELLAAVVDAESHGCTYTPETAEETSSLPDDLHDGALSDMFYSWYEEHAADWIDGIAIIPNITELLLYESGWYVRGKELPHGLLLTYDDDNRCFLFHESETLPEVPRHPRTLRLNPELEAI